MTPTPLATSPIRPVLLATDLEAAREFYHEKLGLPILSEREGAIEFRCGGDTRLAVSKSTVGTADIQTQVAWSVSDLEATLAALRANGIEIEDYDLPELTTHDGIADVGFGRMAWIIDPCGNCLGIVQEHPGDGLPANYPLANLILIAGMLVLMGVAVLVVAYLILIGATF